MNTNDIIKGSKNLEYTFAFSNLDKNHEIFSNKNEKVLGKFKLETPKSIWIHEFVCLRSKMFSLKCGDDSKNKLKGVSKYQSKRSKFEEYYNCLFVGEYQKNVIIIFFVQLTLKRIFKKLENERYLYSMINHVIEMKLKVYHGIENIEFE